MIALIDYGMGNLRSVAKAIQKVGGRIKPVTSGKELNKAKKVVLPGVGAFYDSMLGLRRFKLINPLIKNIEGGKPFLGLCLGMQLLFSESEEGGRHNGLGILQGKVKKFKSSKLKVPQMGWNQIKIKVRSPQSIVHRTKTKNHGPWTMDHGLKSKNSACPLLKGIPDGSWMYFVHSYYVAPGSRDTVAATTDYGVEFASIIWKDNIYATQFHPEKSQEAGLKILENFVSL